MARINEISEKARRDAQRMLDDGARGYIDDSSIDEPDDEHLTVIKRARRRREAS